MLTLILRPQLPHGVRDRSQHDGLRAAARTGPSTSFLRPTPPLEAYLTLTPFPIHPLPHLAQFLAFHDGFKGTHRWYNFLESPSPHRPHVPATDGLDRVVYDSHRYLAFTEPDLRSVREQVLKVRRAPEPFLLLRSLR